MPNQQPAKISIIIPVLNEESVLANSLGCLRKHSGNAEIIVVDGGSTDNSEEICRQRGARFIRSEPGRARQMNRGAREAAGDILLFLHADTMLPPTFAHLIVGELADASVVAGVFKLRIDSVLPGIRLVERFANYRASALRMPYGDQGLFVRKSTFNRMGGYTDIPILEDLELVRRLARVGRVAIIPEPVLTSGRRWLKRGVVRTTLKNQAIVLAYYLGVSPRTLDSWYRAP